MHDMRRKIAKTQRPVHIIVSGQCCEPQACVSAGGGAWSAGIAGMTGDSLCLGGRGRVSVGLGIFGGGIRAPA